MFVKKYHDGDCIGYEEVPDPVVENQPEEQENGKLDSSSSEETGSVAQGTGS